MNACLCHLIHAPSWPTVIPSTPGAPLLAFTRAWARFMFAGSQTCPMRWAVKARCRSFAVGDDDSPMAAAWIASSPLASGIGCAGVSRAGISRSIRSGCRCESLIELGRNCLASEDSALRPAAGGAVNPTGERPRRLCRDRATTASADSCAVVSHRCRRGGPCGRRRRPPRVSHVSLAQAPPDLPPRHPNEYGRLDLMLDYPCRGGLVSGSCSSGLTLPSWRLFLLRFLQIRPRGRHPCLDGRFRSSRSVEDFHLLNT